MMNALRDKLVGKKISSISHGIDDWGISFSDGSGITCYTRIVLDFFSQKDEFLVKDVEYDSECISIRIGKASMIKIFTSEDYIDGPEIFYFRDYDGFSIVE